MKKVILGISVALLAGCATKPPMSYSKVGVSDTDYKRDSYECMQQSKTSYGGGGSGLIGLAMIAGSAQSAQDTANATFSMCMEARGYSGRVIREGEVAALTRATDFCNSILKSPAIDPLRTKTFIPPMTAPTSQMLADGSKMTPGLQPVMLEWGKVRHQCLERWDQERASINYPSQLMDLGKVSATLGSVNAIRLYKGEISWGEANQRRHEVNIEQNRLFAKVSALLAERTPEALQRANQLVLDEQQVATSKLSAALAIPPNQAACPTVKFGDLAFPYCP